MSPDRNGNPLVSVIVPVFNTRKYLGMCLDSILRQQYDNFEVIVVDDGSTDNSSDICDDYAERDKRIRIFHRDNNGIVNTRKFGLEKSKGEYILPVDSDDWIEQGMIKDMVSIALQFGSEIVQCGIQYLYENGVKTCAEDALKEGNYNLSDKDSILFEKLFWDPQRGTRGLRSNLCSCMFLKSCIYHAQMNAPDSVVNGEDDVVYYAAVLNAKSYYYLKNPFYMHYIRTDSLGRSKSLYNVEQVIKIDKTLKDTVESHIAKDKIEWRYRKYLFDQFNDHMRMSLSVSVEKHYLFPFDMIKKRHRVIIYGAGKVGRSFIIQNKERALFHLVAVIDNKSGMLLDDICTEPISNILLYEVDYIIIAILNESRAYEAIRSIVELGIDRTKILWKNIEQCVNSYYLS